MRSYGPCEWLGVPPHDLGPGRAGKRFCSDAHRQAAHRADVDARVDDLVAFIDSADFAKLALKITVDTLPKSASPEVDRSWFQAFRAAGFDEQQAHSEARRMIRYTPESLAKHAGRSLELLSAVINRCEDGAMAIGIPAVAARIRKLPSGYCCRFGDAIQWADVYQVAPPRYDGPTRRALGKACSTCRSVLTARPTAARTTAARTTTAAPKINHPPLIPGNLRHQDHECGQCASARRILPSLSASLTTPLGAIEAQVLRNAVSSHQPVPPADWRKIWAKLTGRS
jgi:hypothetical protein